MRKTLEYLINGGAVRRFHALEVNRPPTDAEHSWGVAVLCYLLSHYNAPRTHLLMAALTHDLGEQEAGDVPSQTKRVGTIGAQLEALETVLRKAQGLDWSEKLTPEEAIILNVADQLEGMLYCVRERRMGNLNVRRAYERWATWLREQPKLPKLCEIEYAIKEMWEEANEKS